MSPNNCPQKAQNLKVIPNSHLLLLDRKQSHQQQHPTLSLVLTSPNQIAKGEKQPYVYIPSHISGYKKPPTLRSDKLS